MKSISQLIKTHETRTCQHCGGAYSPASTWGDSHRRIMLFECEWCEQRNLAAVTVDSDASSADLPESHRDALDDRRDQYPGQLTVLTVGAFVVPGMKAETVELYFEENGSIRLKTDGGFDHDTEIGLLDSLRHPAMTVGVDDDGIVVGRRTGGFVGSGDGTPNASPAADSSSGTDQSVQPSPGIAAVQS